MIAPKFSELEKLTDQQLREQYDKLAQHTVVGTGFIIEEIRSRSANRIAESVEWLTRWIFWLTILMGLATAVQLGLSLQLFFFR